MALLSTSPPECDIHVRNTFIHFDDRFDDEDALPVFYRHTRSSPSDLHSMRRTLPGAVEEARDSKTESKLSSSEMKEEVEALESTWVNHKLGHCMPCAYFILKPGGCRKGSQCDRCHLCTKQDLQQWKRTARKARGESWKLARERRGKADQATPAEVAPEAQDTTRGRSDSDDDSSDDLSWSCVVKNTFLHFSDGEEEDAGSLSVRMCRSEGRAFQLEAFRARLSGLVSESASLDGKKRGSGSCHSSCSTSPGPSVGRLSRWHSTVASSSDPTEVRESLEEADDAGETLVEAGNVSQSFASHPTSLETRGTSFETHQAGECKPCFYFNFKADCCRKGADCIYCHFCSNQESKRRKRTTKTLAKQLKKAYETRCC